MLLLVPLMSSISTNSPNISEKTWYTAAEVADIAVNFPDGNSPDTDIEDEDESDIESDLEDIDNLRQLESETGTS